jgi:hypothetical protein
VIHFLIQCKLPRFAGQSGQLGSGGTSPAAMGQWYPQHLLPPGQYGPTHVGPGDQGGMLPPGQYGPTLAQPRGHVDMPPPPPGHYGSTLPPSVGQGGMLPPMNDHTHGYHRHPPGVQGGMLPPMNDHPRGADLGSGPEQQGHSHRRHSVSHAPDWAHLLRETSDDDLTKHLSSHLGCARIKNLVTELVKNMETDEFASVFNDLPKNIRKAAWLPPPGVVPDVASLPGPEQTPMHSNAFQAL